MDQNMMHIAQETAKRVAMEYWEQEQGQEKMLASTYILFDVSSEILGALFEAGYDSHIMNLEMRRRIAKEACQQVGFVFQDR